MNYSLISSKSARGPLVANGIVTVIALTLQDQTNHSKS